MDLPNIFTKPVTDSVINRINQLQPGTVPNWGKMNAGQVLAHCNVQYEMVYEPEKFPAPNFLMRFVLKTFIKKAVTSTTPYKHNSQTAPAFIIKGERDFELEKNRLIGFIHKTQELGENNFDQKKSISFGALSKNEWNNLFYKHLDHHLTQFGV